MTAITYSTEGVHVIYDLWGVDSEKLDDIEYLEDLMNRAIAHCPINVLGTLRHKFSPKGVTILMLLAESHFAIHTYPNDGYISIDCYTCGESDPEEAITVMLRELKPSYYDSKNIRRGIPFVR